MRNPWLNLPTSNPYILPMDQNEISAIEKKINGRPQFKIHAELYPEPFLGNPNSPVVLLNLNPGFSEHDIQSHRDQDFSAKSRINLEHAQMQYPFYLLDPDLSSPGGDWWMKRLRPLIQETSQLKVARNVFCVEYFPYHSQKYLRHNVRFPSQNYNFQLVRQAVVRNALIVIMRSKKIWKQTIPELEKYSKIFVLNSSQNVTISKNNCPDGFEKIVQAINIA